MESRALKFHPSTHIDLIADQADNRLLELAEASNADYLVTGNKNDFTMPEYKGTIIISPREFFELLNT